MRPPEEGEPASFWSASSKASSAGVHWLIENRGGFAYLTGLAMVPSQFLGPSVKTTAEIMLEALRRCTLESITITIDEETSLQGVIYYPPGWNQKDRDHCVLYHNPNGITVPEYFSDGTLSWTPRKIVEMTHCPIILYDYRGTGLSQENSCMSSVQFRPTYASVLADGEAALARALREFRLVKVIGSSLGGGVATVSLDRHLQKKPEDAEKVSLINHDSFSTTARVVIPTWPMTVDWIGWALGGLIDAQTSLNRLIERDIRIVVLCHWDDPVIPQGARMADHVLTLGLKPNVSVIRSEEEGHANLSDDTIDRLRESERFFP